MSKRKRNRSSVSTGSHYHRIETRNFSYSPALEQYIHYAFDDENVEIAQRRISLTINKDPDLQGKLKVSSVSKAKGNYVKLFGINGTSHGEAMLAWKQKMKALARKQGIDEDEVCKVYDEQGNELTEDQIAGYQTAKARRRKEQHTSSSHSPSPSDTIVRKQIPLSEKPFVYRPESNAFVFYITDTHNPKKKTNTFRAALKTAPYAEVKDKMEFPFTKTGEKEGFIAIKGKNGIPNGLAALLWRQKTRCPVFTENNTPLQDCQISDYPERGLVPVLPNDLWDGFSSELAAEIGYASEEVNVPTVRQHTYFVTDKIEFWYDRETDRYFCDGGKLEAKLLTNKLNHAAQHNEIFRYAKFSKCIKDGRVYLTSTDKEKYSTEEIMEKWKEYTHCTVHGKDEPYVERQPVIDTAQRTPFSEPSPSDSASDQQAIRLCSAYPPFEFQLEEALQELDGSQPVIEGFSDLDERMSTPPTAIQGEANPALGEDTMPEPMETEATPEAGPTGKQASGKRKWQDTVFPTLTGPRTRKQPRRLSYYYEEMAAHADAEIIPGSPVSGEETPANNREEEASPETDVSPPPAKRAKTTWQDTVFQAPTRHRERKQTDRFGYGYNAF